MTISDTIIDKITKNGGTFLEMSSVWDYYNCGSFGTKNSNIRKQMIKLCMENKSIKELWVKSGAKGRSQHSKTEMLIFDISSMSKKDRLKANIDYEGRCYTRNWILNIT